jgi:hypothetical protein
LRTGYLIAQLGQSPNLLPEREPNLTEKQAQCLATYSSVFRILAGLL